MSQTGTEWFGEIGPHTQRSGISYDSGRVASISMTMLHKFKVKGYVPKFRQATMTRVAGSPEEAQLIANNFLEGKIH